jgi:hypothetical protein
MSLRSGAFGAAEFERQRHLYKGSVMGKDTIPKIISQLWASVEIVNSEKKIEVIFMGNNSTCERDTFISLFKILLKKFIFVPDLSRADLNVFS